MLHYVDKMYPIDTGVTRPASSLIAIALAHGLALFAAVASSINISGGHVNPAVTLGTLVGGRISFIRAIYYWVAQLLGAILASLLLRLVTAGMVNTFISRVRIALSFFTDSSGIYYAHVLKLKLEAISSDLSSVIQSFLH